MPTKSSKSDEISKLKEENEAIKEENKILRDRVNILQKLNRFDFESKELNLDKSVIWIRFSENIDNSYGNVSDICKNIAKYIKDKRIVVSGPEINSIQSLEISLKERSKIMK
ncbi:MAG: hypothetical protein ACOCUD_03465 [Bacillota bacterium]